MPIPDIDDIRLSPEDEISNLFKSSMQLVDPDAEPYFLPVTNKNVIGDYECINVFTIWDNKITQDDSDNLMGLQTIAKAIKENLPPSDMIEKCYIHDVGYLTIKLSTQWIAKSIQKMLTKGIHTWAPNINMNKVTVDFASRNIAEEMDVGNLRSTLIGDTLGRMLEYSNVRVYRRNHVWEHLGDQATQFGMLIQHLVERYPNSQVKDLPIGELEVLYKESEKKFNEDVEFKMRAQKEAVVLGDPSKGDVFHGTEYMQICEIIQKGYENVYKSLGIHVKEEVKRFYNIYIDTTLESLRKQDLIKDQAIFIEGKTKPLTLVKEDGTFDYASTDLANLEYQLTDRRSDWIVYVTDVGKREYYEMFFSAARLAKWLPTDEFSFPRTTHAGVGLVRTEVVKVVDLLDEAKTRCKTALVKEDIYGKLTAEKLEYTAEALGYGAVKYAYLKKSRTFNYSFNFDEILNDEANTGVYLLNAYAEISSFTKSSRDIEKLKKTGELKLVNNEERELGLHLLQFTEIVKTACMSVWPDILCKYLFDLSQKFRIVYVGYISRLMNVGKVQKMIAGSYYKTRRKKMLMNKKTTDYNTLVSHLTLPEIASDERVNMLLLSKATKVVMKKCFDLLGITPVD